jgi:hypothetical protein
MPLALSRLATASYFLGLSYGMATIFTFTKFRQLQKIVRAWSTTKFFILSLFTACLLRCMCFTTICILDLAKLKVAFATGKGGFDSDVDADALLYDKVIFILFNLPDFIVLSTYFLLMNVWIETYRGSRRHWFSPEQFRRKWTIFYLVYNTCLYTVQLVLYVMLLTARFEHLHIIILAIYYTLSVSNFVLPSVYAANFVYLVVKLSGFPFTNEIAKRRSSSMMKLAVTWSAARLAYGVLIQVGLFEHWINSTTSSSGEVFSMIFMAVYSGCELVPFYQALSDNELFAMLSETRQEAEAHLFQARQQQNQAQNNEINESLLRDKVVDDVGEDYSEADEESHAQGRLGGDEIYVSC